MQTLHTKLSGIQAGIVAEGQVNTTITDALSSGIGKHNIDCSWANLVSLSASRNHTKCK